jgi:hypothetical protein
MQLLLNALLTHQYFVVVFIQRARNVFAVPMTTKLTWQHAISTTPVKVANNEMKSTSFVAMGTTDKL